MPRNKPITLVCPQCGVSFTRTAWHVRRTQGILYCSRPCQRGGAISRTPEYGIWVNLRQRCQNPNNPDYPHYGGRGIGVCPEWDRSFEKFIADVGFRPSAKHTLDRKDNDGHYEPGNVRWATMKEQNRNRRDNRLVTFEGRTQTIMDWSEETGHTFDRLSARLDAGWSVEDALKTPILPCGTYLAGHPPCAKLSPSDVDSIRSLYAAGGVTHEQLARQFGVSRSRVGEIITPRQRTR